MALILIFHNDSTGSDESSNYNVVVKINERIINTRRVEGHRRFDGWEKLVSKAFPCPSCKLRETE